MASNIVKKAKKPNWESRATKALVMALEDHDHVIRAKFGKHVTKSEKNRAWNEIYQRVNSVAKVERTVEEIKKKWSDLSSQVKRKEARRRADARKTGGGAPMEEPSDTELNLIQNNLYF
ncbi:nuclear apoptosis-inducing factor 1-like [Liolophura sinensis]|uniref:nuclear apoptosis-inducing factor 1-like n=1 Tax=Liolophura sinensis TaxID=3198878 RepID=UPI0031587B40